MDAMLGRPLSEIVAEIAVPNLVRAALLGRSNRYREILNLVTAFEAGRWSAVSEFAVRLHLNESQVAAAYLAAIDWAHKAFQP